MERKDERKREKDIREKNRERQTKGKRKTD